MQGGAWRWNVGLLAAALGTGCQQTTVKIEDVKGPVREQRRKASPQAALFTSKWQVEANTITGRLSWQQCDRERWWTESKVETIDKKPYRAAGWTLIAVGSVVAFISSVAQDPNDPKADRTSPLVFSLAGAGLAIGGIVMVASGSSTTVRTLSSKQEHDLETGSCVPPRDFSELVLVMQVAGKAYWPVRLHPNGDVEVDVPQGVTVPTGVDLRLLVYRAPRGAADLPLVKGQILESLRREGQEPGAPR